MQDNLRSKKQKCNMQVTPSFEIVGRIIGRPSRSFSRSPNCSVKCRPRDKCLREVRNDKIRAGFTSAFRQTIHADHYSVRRRHKPLSSSLWASWVDDDIKALLECTNIAQ
ncbi:hypothetical protein NPIL_312161 [Nephila pilipes]|uniref:Uncharacterized protein n=1 Tax=Nephila pilipes TaxID=299642 RepID=A0A8X6TLA5_NEPPI|nr:hypothetical protein NPIL_312161 [Nephila pilipes]